MNRRTFYILLIIVNFYLLDANEIYKIPFGLYNFYPENNSLNFIESLFYNLAFVNLSIGTPSQLIPFQLNINSQTFYVPNKFFNPNKSSTYISISQNEASYPYSDVTAGFNAKDVIKIGDLKKEINFIYETSTKAENNIGNIGLLIPFIFQTDVFPFFSSLKKANIINSYTFTFKYFSSLSLIDTIYNYQKQNKPIGAFIIGDEPHNYESNKNVYNENEYIKIGALYQFDGLYWDINFNSIYTISKNDNNSKIGDFGATWGELNPNIGFIFSTTFYFNTMKNIFFSNFKEICKERELGRYHTYIECDKNEKFMVDSFPTLYFEHKEFETIFNLTFEDTFILDESSNKYIFLILKSRLFNNWVLGSPFLRKYQFTFNTDAKTIGYYKSMNNNKNDKDEIIDDDTSDKDEPKKEEEENEKNEEENENEKNEEENENEKNEEEKEENTKDKEKKKINNNNNNKYIIYVVIGLLFLIFCILFLIIGMWIQKRCINSKRKKRFNELEDQNDDDYSYENKNINLVYEHKNNKKFDENQKEYENNGYKIN